MIVNEERQDGLKLHVGDAEGLKILAAHLQDALAPLADFAYLPDEGAFVGAVSRFRWEKTAANGYERIHSGLRISGVTGVSYSGLDRFDTARVHEILTLVAEDRETEGPTGKGSRLMLIFAGGGAIRLEVDRILCHLEDLGEGWPTVWRPSHPIADA